MTQRLEQYTFFKEQNAHTIQCILLYVATQHFLAHSIMYYVSTARLMAHLHPSGQGFLCRQVSSHRRNCCPLSKMQQWPASSPGQGGDCHGQGDWNLLLDTGLTKTCQMPHIHCKGLSVSTFLLFSWPHLPCVAPSHSSLPLS